MLKKIIIIIALFMFSFQLKAAVYAYNGTFPDHYRFQDVYVHCNSENCALLCEIETVNGSICSWETALNDCRGCTTEQILYSNANGDEMFDHAIDKINDGIHSGTYNNNIINSPNGTFYRTVEWEYDPQTEDCEITIFINEQ